MKKRISRFIFLLCLLSNLLTGAWAQGSIAQKLVPASPGTDGPFYRGSSIGVEVAGPISHYILGSDILSSEVQLQGNLLGRYLPTLEIGYGKADKLNDDNDLHYKTSAPYVRIGLDYNLFHKKPYLPGYLAVGLRYGHSSFKYDVSGPDMQDPNYGGQVSVPFRYEGVKSTASWLELVASVKVQVWKQFHMGWAVRYKARMKVEETENTVPWYVPGFGKNTSGNFVLTYNLMYNLPF